MSAKIRRTLRRVRLDTAEQRTHNGVTYSTIGSAVVARVLDSLGLTWSYRKQLRMSDDTIWPEYTVHLDRDVYIECDDIEHVTGTLVSTRQANEAIKRKDAIYRRHKCTVLRITYDGQSQINLEGTVELFVERVHAGLEPRIWGGPLSVQWDTCEPPYAPLDESIYVTGDSEADYADVGTSAAKNTGYMPLHREIMHAAAYGASSYSPHKASWWPAAYAIMVVAVAFAALIISVSRA